MYFETTLGWSGYRRSIPAAGWVCALVLVSFAVSMSSIADESVISLDGSWQFTFDKQDAGLNAKWFEPGFDRSSWRAVQVPHTWQVEPENTDYYGIAWYARTILSDWTWKEKILRIEFDAIYRDAWIWVNGKLVGEHLGSGWTKFGFAIDEAWNPGQQNLIVVRVDNRFSEKALPYKRSSDWPADGGIIRSARLFILPQAHIDRVKVHSTLNPATTEAQWEAEVETTVPATANQAYQCQVLLMNPEGQTIYISKSNDLEAKTNPVQSLFSGKITHPTLWHFDHPNLYRLCVRLMQSETVLHEKEVSLGIRSVELKDGYIFLNGEPMRLMGVEWMPGSDPRYGMAESPEFMRGVLRNMKELNCLLTQFHWQQDDAVFEFCDRNGILVQEEVPSWGGETMKGNFEGIQERHTREMIEEHYNHPSIYAWGLCNEVDGQNPQSHQFIQQGKELARKYDPDRPLTYASNSLQSNHEKDAAGMLDFIEWNDYYESWYKGTVADVEANLEKIEKAFPGKSLIVSEYGLCECDPSNPTSDERRIEILKTHTDAYRKARNTAGAIFFDYNDYRTHIGDKGQGAFQQRVHGVVDLFNRPKPSWEALRREASPIRSLSIGEPIHSEKTTHSIVEIVTRSLENDLPAYTLRDYLLVWIAYNNKDLPIGTGKKVLPEITPGSTHQAEIEWPTGDSLKRIRVEVFRPTGYSVLEAEKAITSNK